MKRSILIASGAVVIVLAACAELFDEPSQCKSDRDCTKFGGVCDITRAVCVPAPTVPGGEGGPGGDSSISDAAEEPPPPPLPGCDAPTKDTAEITGTPDAAGDSQIGADITLDCTKDWILKDRTFVKAGVKVTIQPGTRILALQNAGLVVERGAKIEASGQSNQPIVFTASGTAPAAGFWRGLYLLGNAPNNGTYTGGAPQMGTYAYGGNQAADSSGTLKYVRVEYATDGLVLGGVGSATTIDYVQVRRTGATQCFAIAGGRFNGKHLVCQYPGDEMFEITNGYDGSLQFLFGHKAPTGGGHNGLLVDTGAYPKIANVTFCGEVNGNTSIAFQWRNNARFEIANAIFTNWGVGTDYVINNGSTPGDPLTLRSSIIAENGTNPAFAEVEGGTPPDNDNGFDELAWIGDASAVSLNSAGLVGCHDVNNLQPWPPATIPGVAPSGAGLDTNANYIGAFKDQNDGWMKGNWIKLTDP
jgi:hypothetical protein